jgi:hypothetical protein
MKYQAQVEIMKDELKTRYDWSLQAAFDAIDWR